MKRKSLAVLLALVTVLAVATAFFAFSLTSAAAPAAPVMNETMTESVVIYVGSASTTLTEGQSFGTTATFSNGVLTINGLNCSKIETTDGGSLIVDVKGTNTINNGTSNRGILVESSSGKADLTITSSTGGKLTVSAGGYTLMSRRGCILVDGNVDLTVSATSNVAMQTGSAGANGAITVAGNAVVKVSSKSSAAIDVPGTETAFYLKDNADLTVTGTGASGTDLGGIKVRGSAKSYVGISGTSKLTVSGYPHAIHVSGSDVASVNISGGTQTLNAATSTIYTKSLASELNVSGKAALNVASSSHGLHLVATTGGTSTFTVADTATVDAKTGGVPVYMQGKAENKLLWTSSGESSFERTKNNAAVMLEQADKATVEIKNGTYTVKGKSGANHNGLFRIDKSQTVGTLINMTVEDATLIVDDTASASTPTMGLRFVGLDGSFLKVLGDSVIDVDVKSSAASNVLTGWYLENIPLTVGGTSVVDINTPGATTGSFGLDGEKVFLQDAAQLKVTSSGMAVRLDSASAEFVMDDESCADLTGGSVALYLLGGGTCDLAMNSTGALNVERTGTSVNGAALYLSGKQNDFSVTSGAVNVVCPSQNIKNSPLNIGSSSPSGDDVTSNVTISGGMVNVTNNNKSSSALTNLAMRVYGTSGAVEISDDAVILLNNNVAGSGDVQIGLLSYVDVTVSDDAMFCAYNNGASAGSDSAAVQLETASLTVEDKVFFDLFSTGGTTFLTSDSSYRVNLKGGLIQLYSGALINNILSLKTASGADIYSGDTPEAAVRDFTLTGVEKYVRMNIGNVPEKIFVKVALSNGVTRMLMEAPLNTMAAGEGTVTYDSANATLTLDNATGIQQIAATQDSLTVVVKGANSIETDGEKALVVSGAGDNLTIQGDGVLSVSASKYAILCEKGDLTVTGDVEINVATTSGYAFLVSGYAADGKAASEIQNLTFAGNAKVVAEGATNAIIANDAATGALIVKDNANVSATNSEPGSWKGAADTTRLEILGGVLELNVTGSQQTATIGIAVSAHKDDVAAGATGAYAKFLGGKLIIKTVNNSAVESNGAVADGRGYGLFLKNLETVEFAGTDIDISVTNKTGSLEPQKVRNRAAITWQSDSGIATAVTLTKGTIKIDADKNTAGLLGDISTSTFTMNGGSVIGNAATLFAINGGAKYTVNGGVINFTAHGAITGEKAKVTVNAQIQKGAADAESKILVLGNAQTSDVDVTAFVLVAVLTLAAGTVILLRKRSAC